MKIESYTKEWLNKDYNILDSSEFYYSQDFNEVKTWDEWLDFLGSEDFEFLVGELEHPDSDDLEPDDLIDKHYLLLTDLIRVKKHSDQWVDADAVEIRDVQECDVVFA